MESLLEVEKHELRTVELKKLFPADAAVAHGRGVKLKRDKRGAIRFEFEDAKAIREKAMADLELTKPAKPRRSRAKAAA